ncbi:MAG: alpha/beta fold hydrolase [Planctomycetota bacterium]|nr:alpha/beta fold hydrolase [Planctomycetota bacterium]
MKSSSVLFVLIAILCSNSAFSQVTFLDEVFPFDKSQPALGTWHGTVTLPQSPDKRVFASFTIVSDQGDPSVTMTLIPAGALSKPGSIVTIQDDTLEISLVGVGGEYRFDGLILDAGQRFKGEVRLIASGDEEAEATTFEFARTPSPLDLPDPLAFSGELSAGGMKIGMSIVLGRTPGGNWVGHLDVPMQSLKGFPLVDITETDDVIRGHMRIPGGATFSVSLDDQNRRMQGVFTQSGMDMVIDFARDLNYAYKEILRPQEPKPPYPYEEREIEVKHPDGFTLAGTLTIPEAAKFGLGPFPVAILISGSGQQDRNESIMGHKPFLIIADYLTTRGIAVMRYDDRGIGGSGGLETLSGTTSEDYATDVVAVVEHLKTLQVIDPTHIGLIGHSEGGLIAPMVSTMIEDIGFMVLMAGPGVKGRELLAVQRRLLSLSVGLSEEDVTVQYEVMEKLTQLALDGASVREIVNECLRLSLEEDPDLGGMTEELFRKNARGQLAVLTKPWMLYFLDYDPAPALAQVTCPVLAINGTKDLQVWHEQNLDTIERTLSEQGIDVTAIRYEGLNHLFQPAQTGAISEYAEIDITIDEGVLRDMASWIESKVK